MRKCLKVYSKQFWLNGRLVTPCCVLFISLEGGACVTSSFNDETGEFEVFEIEEEPDYTRAEGDEEFYYPYKELMSRRADEDLYFRGYQVSTNQIEFNFSGDVSLKLAYDVKTETEVVRFST